MKIYEKKKIHIIQSELNYIYHIFSNKNETSIAVLLYMLFSMTNTIFKTIENCS